MQHSGMDDGGVLWTKLAVVSQIALVLYLELIEWVNLFPWNDVRRGNGQAGLDVAIGVLMAGAILATARRLRWAMATASALYGGWLWLQIETWWIGYIRGASPAWKRTYARFFSQTVQALPIVGDHLPPDASHLVLQLLIATAMVATATATFRVWAKAGQAGSKSGPDAIQHDGFR